MRAFWWSLMAAMLGGCSDASLKTVNSSPAANITSHMDGDEVTADQSFTIMGVVGDSDDREEELRATWLMDAGVLCDAVTPDSSGFTQCELSLAAGETVVTLIAQDPSGANSSAQVKLVAVVAAGDDTGEPEDTGHPEDTGEPPVNAVPACTITAPLDGAEVTAGAEVAFSGTVSDAEDAGETLAISWTSDLDGMLGSAAADTDGAVWLSTDSLTVGVHTVTLTATDTDGEACEAAISLSINGQPTAPVVVIEPGPAFTEDDLSAVIVTASTDPEGDPITYTYAWTVDGAPVATTDATILASETIKGELWEVTVTPADALSAGESATTDREVSNTPPQVLSAVLSPDPAATNDTVSVAITVADADGDPVAAMYAWTVNGLTVAETGSSLSGTPYFDKHDEVAVTVTPLDTGDEGDPLSSDVLVIINTPPEAPEVEIEPETPMEGIDMLECVIVTESTDADEDFITYTTDWTVDGVSYTGPFGVSELSELWASSETPGTGYGYGIDWGDFDRDGDLDLAVANLGGVNHVYRNDGSTFTMVWSSPESDNNMSAAWADFDDDGHLDVVFGGYWGSPTRVYTGDSSTFTLAWTSSTSAEVWDLAWGDLNGDDLPDLAVGNETGANQVYENTGGDLSLVWESTDTAGTLGMAWGDWDGDGDDDLAIGNQKPCGTCSPGHPDQVYQNDGGTLSLAWTAPDSDGTYTVDWADIDGDGDLDLAAGGSSGAQLRVYENTGGDLTSIWTASPGNVSTVAWGDMDGDGDPDLMAIVEGQAVVWDNDGGSFTEIWSDGSRSWGAGAVADMDGDGDTDMVTGSGSGQPAVVWESISCADCVPGSETHGGELWECTVTPDDGEAEGDSATATVTIDSMPVYRWAYQGTDSIGMIYGSCAHSSSYSASCAPALVGEVVYINESGGAALERKALGETHLATEPGGRGYSVSLSADELEISWSGATSCGADWLRIDTVDVYECIVE
jgi:hypothetical protein